jgi:hypothetical protein
MHLEQDRHFSLQRLHGQNGLRGDAADHNRQHHLLIAGTGRAGTSALVRYLTALGLETHLTKRGQTAEWYDTAQAGLEDLPLSSITPDLPYVVKSPWAYQLIEEILANPETHLDAVIIPIRDLLEAAASRTILQLRALHEDTDWMTRLSTTWEHWGATPGGTIFSLNPIDQARLLAVGFHRLLERLVQADVPTVLLAFPRLATDPDYLFRKLSPMLRLEVTVEQARVAHAATFNDTMVRVADELSKETEASYFCGGLQGPTLHTLDNIALKRNLNLLRDKFAEAKASQKTLEYERDVWRAQLEQVQRISQEHEAEAAQIISDLKLCVQTAKHDVSLARLRTKEAEVRAEHARATATDALTRAERAELQAMNANALAAVMSAQVAQARIERDRAVRDRDAVLSSTAWRMTRLLRAMGDCLPSGLRRLLHRAVRFG